MSILDDIKENKIDVLHLSKMPEDYFERTEEFVNAMTDNTSIRKVVFDNDFLGCAASRERAQLVSAVGTLKNIESVTLKDTLLMVGICVTNLAKNGKTLQELSMENCMLQGIPDDFGLLMTAINNNPSFKSLHVTDCTAPNKNVNLTNEMAKLKKGMAVH